MVGGGSPEVEKPQQLGHSEAKAAADSGQFDVVFCNLELRTMSAARKGHNVAESQEETRGILNPEIETDNRSIREAIDNLDCASKRGAVTAWTHPHPSPLWKNEEAMAWGERSESVILASDMRAFGASRGRRVGTAVNPRGLEHFEGRPSKRCCQGHSHDTGPQRRDPGKPDRLLRAVRESLESVGRAKGSGGLAQPRKARAKPRNPWEARIGDLAECLPWTLEWAWKEKPEANGEMPHINVLELRGREW